MINHGTVSEHVVFEEWRAYEGRPESVPIRTDIIHAGFPRDAAWYDCEIENQDIEKLFLISVSDLGPFSRQTWSLQATVENYLDGFYDRDHSRRFENLVKKVPPYTTRLVLVSDCWNGPFTLIDGNHRAVLLQVERKLAGTRVHLAIHPRIRAFDHAGMAYRHFRN